MSLLGNPRGALLALVMLAASPSLFAATDECQRTFLTRGQMKAAFEQEFSAVLPGFPGLERSGLRVKKFLLRSRVLKACSNAGGCTAEQLAREVRSAVGESGISNAWGYGFLIGGMVANSAVSSGILTAISPDLDFVPIFAGSFLGQLSFVTVNLLSPFLEPISGKIKRSTFSAAKGGANHPGADRTLEDQADQTFATYTLREQHATDRILKFSTLLQLGLEAAARAVELGDREKVVAQLGEAARLGYRHFRDVSPDDPTIAGAIHASFLRKVAAREELYLPVLDYIRERDAQSAVIFMRPGELSADEYYEKALGAWLK